VQIQLARRFSLNAACRATFPFRVNVAVEPMTFDTQYLTLGLMRIESAGALLTEQGKTGAHCRVGAELHQPLLLTAQNSSSQRAPANQLCIYCLRQTSLTGGSWHCNIAGCEEGAQPGQVVAHLRFPLMLHFSYRHHASIRKCGLQPGWPMNLAGQRLSATSPSFALSICLTGRRYHRLPCTAYLAGGRRSGAAAAVSVDLAAPLACPPQRRFEQPLRL